MKKLNKLLFMILAAFMLSMMAPNVISLPVSAATESGSTLSTAVNVTFGTSYSKSWTSSTDHLNHYCKVVMPERGILNINATKPKDSDEYGALLFVVYDSDGEKIWDNDCYYAKSDAKDYYSINVGLNAGTYYVTIKPGFYVTSGTISTTYKFSYTATDYCEVEPNEGLAQATALTSGQMYQGYYGEQDDLEEYDYYSFSATQNNKYRIKVGNFSKISATTVMIYLIDPSGDSDYIKLDLAKCLDSEGNNYLEFNAQVSGTYYIKIDNYHMNQLSYTVGFEDLGHVHNYGAWTTTKQPTCVSEGEKTRTCTLCGETETATISKSSTHTYGAWEIVAAATCTDEGSKQRTCIYCGNIQTATIAKSAHSYGAWEVIAAATCTKEGSKQRTCTYCGTVQTVAIEKTSHNYGAWEVVEATTCTKDGLKQRTCADCGNVQEATITKLGHSWNQGVITKQATVEAPGVKTYTCTNCGATYTESIPQLQPAVTGTALTAVKNVKGRKLAIKWKKNTGVNGYVIQMSTNKAFTSGVIKKVVKSNQKISFKSSKLKLKKTYFVRVCTYMTVGGQTYYSNWSNLKKVKIKK